MFLDDKYIILTKNNTHNVINFLFDNGYCFSSDEEKKNILIIKILEYIEQYNLENFYLELEFGYMGFPNSPSKNRTFLDINHLLREEKLKRILL